MFLIFLITIVAVYAKKLSINQWSAIQNILQNPGCTPYMRKTINNVIYENYHDWALCQARHYQHNKPYVLSSNCEMYAIDGLWYAIQKYNPKYPFYPFAKMYVYSYLYRASKERLNERPKEPHPNTRNIGHIDDSNLVEKDRLDDIWTKVHEFSEPKDRVIFHWKYDTMIGRYRSNLEVAKIMGLSEESIRQSIYRTKQRIRKESDKMDGMNNWKEYK